MIRRRVDTYGELNDSELAEREQRRHETDWWPLPSIKTGGDGLMMREACDDSTRRFMLAKAVRDGEEECCGEWQEAGYNGRCSKLGRTTWFREIGRDSEGPRYKLCGGCPVAWKMQNIGHWLVDVVDEIEAICEGESDVWTGYGIGE